MSEVLKKVKTVENKVNDKSNVIKGNFFVSKNSKINEAFFKNTNHAKIAVVIVIILGLIATGVLTIINRKNSHSMANQALENQSKETINHELYSLIKNESYREIPASLGKLVAKWEYDHPALTNNYSIALKRNGHKYQSIKILNDAIGKWPQLEYFYNNRGIIYLEDNKYSEAILDFKKALELDPNYKEATINLAIAYEKTRKWTLAFEFYKNYLTQFTIEDAQKNIITERITKMLPMVMYESKRESKK